MKIQLEIEVDDIQALQDLLLAGREYSLQEFKVINWKVLTGPGGCDKKKKILDESVDILKKL